MSKTTIVHKLNKSMKGSLPDYIVNLQEFGDLLLELMNSNKIMDYGVQKIDGIHLKVDGNLEQEVIWQRDEPFAIITGIEIGLNDCRNIGSINSIDMYINNIKYFDDIYFKENYSEYKELSVRRVVTDKDVVKFVFKNRDFIPTDVYIHIHYLGSLDAKKYNIICIDKNTGNRIYQYSIPVLPPDKFEVCPPDIDGYNKLSQCVTIDTEVYQGYDIIFEYERVPNQYNIICVDKATGNKLSEQKMNVVPPKKFKVCPPDIDGYNKISECVTIDTETYEGNNIVFIYEPIRPPIEHDYDWLFELHWECDADLDFYCVLGDYGTVRFGKKKVFYGDENKAWLDADYTQGKRGRPEIITILGFEDVSPKIGINRYRGTVTPNDEVIVKAYKYKSNNPYEPVYVKKINSSLLSENKQGDPIYFFEVSLITGNIVELIN